MRNYQIALHIYKSLFGRGISQYAAVSDRLIANDIAKISVVCCNN